MDGLVQEQDELAYAGLVRAIVGRSCDMRSSRVPTTSAGILLTRFAPLRIAILPAWDIPERFDRIDPASDPVAPGSRIRAGGAKSKAVNMPDLRRACLK
jgi:hypothetical protein